MPTFRGNRPVTVPVVLPNEPQTQNLGRSIGDDVTVPQTENLGQVSSEDVTIPESENLGQSIADDATVALSENLGQSVGDDVTIPQTENLGRSEANDVAVIDGTMTAAVRSRFLQTVGGATDKTQVQGVYRQGQRRLLFSIFRPQANVPDAAGGTDGYGYLRGFSGLDPTWGSLVQAISTTPFIWRMWAWDNAYVTNAIDDLDLKWADLIGESFYVDWDGGGGADNAKRNVFGLTAAGTEGDIRVVFNPGASWTNTSGVTKNVAGIVITLSPSDGAVEGTNFATEAQTLDATYGQYRAELIHFVKFDSPIAVLNGASFRGDFYVDFGFDQDTLANVSGNTKNATIGGTIGLDHNWLQYLYRYHIKAFSPTVADNPTVSSVGGVKTWGNDNLSVGGTGAAKTFAVSGIYTTGLTYAEPASIPTITIPSPSDYLQMTGASPEDWNGVLYTQLASSLRLLGFKTASPVTLNPGDYVIVDSMTFSFDQSAL